MYENRIHTHDRVYEYLCSIRWACDVNLAYLPRAPSMSEPEHDFPRACLSFGSILHGASGDRFHDVDATLRSCQLSQDIKNISR